MLLPLGLLTAHCGMTNWLFLIFSCPLNVIFLWKSFKFYQQRDTASAKSLFKTSLFYLPWQMVFMVMNKKSGPGRRLVATKFEDAG
jgi:heme O synthase-like polyprenyltransferase